MDTYFNQQNNHGIMGEDDDDLDSISSSSSSVSNASSDFMEDATSSSSLFEMSSLMQQLPFKRGLSKHFQGKSQSFTSLSNVRCLEDLAKPCKKKLKSCKSYAGGLSESNNKVSHPSKTISKKGSAKGSWSSLSVAKRSNSFLGNKPPIPPQRASNLFNQTPLFA